MPKTKISEFSSTPANNTDIDSINIAEGCAPSGINDAIRELMAQLKDFQTGAVGDSFNGPVGTTTAAAGAFTTLSATGNVTLGDASTDTLNVGNGGLIKDASGNLGLQTAGSTQTLGSALQLGRVFSFAQDVNSGYLGAGWFGTNSGTATYAVTGNYAVRQSFDSSAGSIKWFTAPTGTAGNTVTFTQAMTLDASGNLGVGTTSPSSYGKFAVVSTGTSTTTALLNGSGASASNTVSTDYWSGNSFGGLEKIATIGAINPNAGSNNGGAIYFSTSSNGTSTTPTERARIDSSGNLLVGTTGNVLSSRLTVAKNNSSTLAFFSQDYSAGNADNVAFVNGYATGSNAAVQCRFYNNSLSSVGTITSSGSATAYNTSSDYRLKNTIAPITGALVKVAQLKPVTYKWNADGSDGEGFIAHELAEICPQAVAGEKDAVDDNGNPVYQGIDVSFLVATLTAAIQEQQAIIESLKARLDAANL